MTTSLLCVYTQVWRLHNQDFVGFEGLRPIISQSGESTTHFTTEALLIAVALGLSLVHGVV